MALSNVKITKQDGNLGSVLAGQDHVSALVFFGSTKPAAWTANVKLITSVKKAEDEGITATSHAVEHYHITEFFKKAQGAELWVGMYPELDGTSNFSEIVEVKNITEGIIRQYGVFTRTVFTTGLIGDLQTVMEQLETESAPASAVLTANMEDGLGAALDLGTLPEIKTLGAEKVSVDLGQSGKGLGKNLATSTGSSVGTVGRLLGTIAASSVEQSVGDVDAFNQGDSELDVLAFSNGVQYDSVGSGSLDALDTKGYVFLRKFAGYSGSYYNFGHTASNQDYHSIERNRAIDKVVRGVRNDLIGKVNSRILVVNGEINPTQLQALESRATRSMNEMIRNSEISAGSVKIDASSILTTGILNVEIKVTPVGIAKEIVVSLGFQA